MLRHPEPGTVAVHEKYMFSSVSVFLCADTQGKSWDWFRNCVTANTSEAGSYSGNALILHDIILNNCQEQVENHSPEA